jgi:hypothetical protein
MSYDWDAICAAMRGALLARVAAVIEAQEITLPNRDGVLVAPQVFDTYLPRDADEEALLPLVLARTGDWTDQDGLFTCEASLLAFTIDEDDVQGFADAEGLIAVLYEDFRATRALGEDGAFAIDEPFGGGINDEAMPIFGASLTFTVVGEGSGK